jgi:hypothetical protein
MPGKSKKGGGLEVGSSYKMKNSVLKMSAKYGSPMQGNYGSSMKHMGEAKHPTGDIKSHDGHMSKKMTKKIATKKEE